MAILGGHPKFKALDSTGAPLVGGKLYTYAAGTTTGKLTYIDASESAVNTNPVILDARGEADVWFTGTYKLVLKDADDTTIWTVDNYDPLTVDLDSGILDANGNEQVTFSATASAVNYVELTNAPVGDSPSVLSKGLDANVDLTLSGKGTGTVVLGSDVNFAGEVLVSGSASSAAYITLGEDTDNGSNTVTIQAPASLAADRTIVLPSGAPAADEMVSTDASGNWSYLDVSTLDLTDQVTAATTSAAGKVELATEAEATAATSTSLIVTPATLGNGPQACIGWVRFDPTSLPLIVLDSYLVDSVTYVTTAVYRVNWTNEAEDQAVFAQTMEPNPFNDSNIQDYALEISAGSVKVSATAVRNSTSLDVNEVSVIRFGSNT